MTTIPEKDPPRGGGDGGADGGAGGIDPTTETEEDERFA